MFKPQIIASPQQTPRGLEIWRARAQHIAAKLATLTLGAAYVSAGVAALRRRHDRAAPRPRFSGRTALVAHAFYTDLIGEILACHETLPADAELLLTTSSDGLTQAEQAVAGAARAHAVAVPNRGRDIAPFLLLLNRGDLARYDVVLKLHTKRSPHLLDGNIRRRLLYARLAGSRRRTQAVLSLFEEPTTGMIGWGPCWRSSAVYWMNNRVRVAELAAAMGLPPPATPAFFEGSMFWVRPAALKRLSALPLTPEQFEPEADQLDGTLQHAVERIFALAVAAEGYVVRDLKGRILFGPTDISRAAARG